MLKPITDELVRVETNLVLLGEPAEGGDIDDVRNALELLAQCPVRDGLHLHHVAFEDSCFRACTSRSGRLDSSQSVTAAPGPLASVTMLEPLENSLAIPAVVGGVVEVHHEAGNSGQGEGAQIVQVREPGHLDLGWNGDLLFDVFGGMSWPLRNHVDIVVRNVRVGLDGKILERDDSPKKQEHRRFQEQESGF